MLKELDPFLKDESESKRESTSQTCQSCLRRTKELCVDKGVISVAITFLIFIVGVVLLVVARSLDIGWLDELARYFISAGLFGFASGGTNGLAVLMLLYRIPLLCGSG